MSLLDVVGETPEFEGGGSVLLPASYYPVSIEVREADYNPKSGSPFADLQIKVLSGPFADAFGAEASFRQRYSLSFGSTAESKGGIIPLLFGACTAITGKEPDEQALAQHGYVPLSKQAGEDPKAYGARVRLALKEFMLALDPAARLDCVGKLLRVVEWNGKQAVASVEIEEGTGNSAGKFFNRVKGWYKLDHPEKGMQYVASECFPKQQAEIDAQAQQ